MPDPKPEDIEVLRQLDAELAAFPPEKLEKAYTELRRNLPEILRALGRTIFLQGSIELEAKEYLEWSRRANENPLFVEQMLKRVPPEKLSAFLSVMIRTNAVMSRMSEMSSLGPDDKKALGLALEDLGRQIEELFEEKP